MRSGFARADYFWSIFDADEGYRRVGVKIQDDEQFHAVSQLNVLMHSSRPRHNAAAAVRPHRVS